MSRAGFGLQALVLLALCGAIQGRLDMPAGTSTLPSPPESAPLDAERAPVERFSLPRISAFAEILERPLFASTRRPTPPAPVERTQRAAAPAQTRPAPDAGAFILSAIVIVEDQRAALLTDPANGQLTRRREGEVIGEWALDEIRPDAVVLRHGQETKEVLLRRFEEPAASARSTTRQAKAKNMTNILQQHLQQKTEAIKRLQAQIVDLQNAQSPQPGAPPPPAGNCGLSRC